jgi:hypothetical protein
MTFRAAPQPVPPVERSKLGYVTRLRKRGSNLLAVERRRGERILKPSKQPIPKAQCDPREGNENAPTLDVNLFQPLLHQSLHHESISSTPSSTPDALPSPPVAPPASVATPLREISVSIKRLVQRDHDRIRLSVDRLSLPSLAARSIRESIKDLIPGLGSYTLSSSRWSAVRLVPVDVRRESLGLRLTHALSFHRAGSLFASFDCPPFHLMERHISDAPAP